MATAVKLPIPKPVEPKPQVQLTLSSDEAELLVSFLRRIGGTGPDRDLANNLLSVLVQADVKVHGLGSYTEGSLYVK